jgi:hypothetical protein
MGRRVQLSVELPADLAELRLPAAVQRRLQHLLDSQDHGERLSREDREEAEGLVDIAEVLTLLRLQSDK